MNEQAGKISVAGFPLGSSVIPKDGNLSYAKKIAPSIKPIVEKVPAGYAMQIKGHACSVGTDSANINVSRLRAKAVYLELVRSGVPAKKMKWTGVGVNEMVSGISEDDAKQRRVTFQVVPL